LIKVEAFRTPAQQIVTASFNYSGDLHLNIGCELKYKSNES